MDREDTKVVDKDISTLDQDRISYRNNGTNCYMVIRGGEEPRLPYQINTIRYNKIEGLLPVFFLIEDGEYRYFYEVTGKESLYDQMKNRKYTLTEIRTILSDLYRCIRRMEEYLLDMNLLMVTPEYIFSDKRKNEYYFCFYPEKKESFETSFQGLLEYFMNFLDYQDENTVVLVYSMYQKSRGRHTSFAELMQGFWEIEESSEKVHSENAYLEKEYENRFAKDSFYDEKEAAETDFFDGEGCYKKRSDSIDSIFDGMCRKAYVFIPYIPDVAGGYAAAMVLKFLREQYGVLSVIQRVLCVAAVIGIAGSCGCISLYLMSVIRQKQGAAEPKDETADDDRVQFEEKRNPAAYAFEEYSFQGNEYETEQKDPFDQRNQNRRTYGDQSAYGNQRTYGEQKTYGNQSAYGNQRTYGEQMAYGDRMTYGNSMAYKDQTMYDVAYKKPVRDRIPATVVMHPSGSICSENPVLVSCNRAKSHDIVIDREEILIGKIQGVVDCYLNGKNVSRIHAKVFRNQEGYEIVDMGSTNGTYVNGERITERKKVCLNSGDEVQLADLKFVFKNGTEENESGR